MNEVEAFYDNSYDEWERFDRHIVEFEITKRYLNRYLGDRTGLKVFDIGGGPGRYALHLSVMGHQVTLLDLSRKNLETARRKASEAGIVLADVVHGNALQLQGFDTDYDVVLLMGPLYHLIHEAERTAVMEQAMERLKPGGLFLAAFISSYAPIHDSLFRPGELGDEGQLLEYLRNGVNQEGEGFTTAYFWRPEEAMEFMREFPLTQLEFAGVENVLGPREAELRLLPKEQLEKWLNVGMELSRDQRLLGASLHYLYIGQKRKGI